MCLLNGFIMLRQALKDAHAGKPVRPVSTRRGRVGASLQGGGAVTTLALYLAEVSAIYLALAGLAAAIEWAVRR